MHLFKSDLTRLSIIFYNILALIFLSAKNLSSQVEAPFDYSDKLEVLASLQNLKFQTDNETAIAHADSLLAIESISDDDIAQCEIFLAMRYAYSQKDSLSRVLFLKNEAALINDRDTSGILYAHVLDGLAFLKMNKKEYEEGLKYQGKSLNIYLNTVGEKHIKYARATSFMGHMYGESGKYDDAIANFKLSKDVYFSLFGNEHKYYLGCLNNLGVFCSRARKLTEALIYYEEALEIREKMLSPNDPELAKLQDNIALVYHRTDQFEKSELNYKKSLETFENLLGTNHRRVVRSIINMGHLYCDMGLYQTSEEHYTKAQRIIKEIDKPDPYMDSRLISNFAILKMEMGDYDQAEDYYIEYLNYTKNIIGEKDNQYARALNNYGIFKLQMGQYKKAEEFFIEAMTIREALYGKEHYLYAYNTSSLGNVNYYHKEYDKALKFFEETLKIRSKAHGENHSLTLQTKNNIASVYKQLGQLEKAKSMILEIKDHKKLSLGESHPSYAVSLKGLGIIYMELGQYKLAEEFASEAEQIQLRVLGENNSEYIQSLRTLTNIAIEQKEYDKAIAYSLKSNKIQKARLLNSFEFLAENEKFNFHQVLIGDFDITKNLSMVLSDPKITEEVYSTILIEKGMHLQSSLQTKAFVFSQGNDTLIKDHSKLLSLNRQRIKQLEKPLDEQTNLKNLESQIEQIEKTLAKASSSYRNELYEKSITIEDIKNVLREDEIAIEFTQFDISAPTDIDTIVYAASILEPNGKTHFFPLCSEKELIGKIHAKNNSSNYINEIYGHTKRGLIVDGQPERTFFEMLWSPFDSLTQGKSTVYFSPCGFLNRLNFNAISVNEDEVLADKYEMINFLSTKSIAKNQNEEEIKSAFIFGDIDYEDNETKVIDTTSLVSSNAINFSNSNKTTRGGKWSKLKWTKQECELIHKTLTNSEVSVEYKNQKEATEDAFKNLGVDAPSPSIIHLATHGYFFPDPENQKNEDGQSVFEVSKHPLLRSGLILSNGNYAWEGNTVSDSGEDGILTAYEISNMNLTNTELVVLSACETGLGDIKGSEGVFGLQRAFKMAGAKNIIMSLWHIPDRATKDFMTNFYENWMNDKSTIREAFNKTQLEMRDRFYDPYNWAGFILVE